MNDFFLSQCGYCPLVWMIHRRVLNSHVNGLRERALRLVCSDFNFNKVKSVIIHQRNLQKLAYEMFKVKKN